MFFTKKIQLEHEKLLESVDALWKDNCTLCTMIRGICSHSEYVYFTRTRGKFCGYNTKYIKKCRVCGYEEYLSLEQYDAGVSEQKLKKLEDEYESTINHAIKLKTQLREYV